MTGVLVLLLCTLLVLGVSVLIMLALLGED